LIAEHSFRRDISKAELRPLTRSARALVLRCDTSNEEAGRRFAARERAHKRIERGRLAELIGQMELGTFDWSQFGLCGLDVPRLHVDTTGTYEPALKEIVAFCRTVGADSRGWTDGP
jgi:hypothetical protein